MIGVLGPKLAIDEGTCNGCSEQIGLSGTIKGSEVYVFQAIGKRGGGMSFRLCEDCVLKLQSTLNSLWPLEQVDSHG